MSHSLKFFSGLLVTVFLCFGAWADNPDHVQQASETGSCSICDLSNAYFKDFQVKSGDLSYACLQGVNLTFANLRESSIDGADLLDADMALAATASRPHHPMFQVCLDAGIPAERYPWNRSH